MKTLSLGLRVTLLTITTSITAVTAVLLIAYNGVVQDFENVLTQRQLLETESAARMVDQELQIRLDALHAFSEFLTDGDRLLPTLRISELLGRQDPVSTRIFEPDYWCSTKMVLLSQRTYSYRIG